MSWAGPIHVLGEEFVKSLTSSLGEKVVALTTTTYVAGAEHLSMLNRPTTSVIVAFNTEIHHFSTSMSLFPFKNYGLKSVSIPDAHVLLVITDLADVPVNESLRPSVFSVFDVHGHFTQSFFSTRKKKFFLYS